MYIHTYIHAYMARCTYLHMYMHIHTYTFFLCAGGFREWLYRDLTVTKLSGRWGKVGGRINSGRARLRPSSSGRESDNMHVIFVQIDIQIDRYADTRKYIDGIYKHTNK